MKFLDLVRSESETSFFELGAFATVSGLSNALMLAVINMAAEKASNDDHSLQHLLMFATISAIFVVAQRHVMVKSSSEIEGVLHKLRLRLTDKIRRTDLQSLERIGRSEIYSAINRETQWISQAVTTLVMGLQSGLLSLFTFFYIAYLSPIAFGLCLVLIVAGMFLHAQKEAQIEKNIDKAREREVKLFDTVDHLLAGFKEVKLNRARSADLRRRIEGISEAARELKVDTKVQVSSLFAYSQILLGCLMATIVFIVPRLSPTYSDVVLKVTSAILFMSGPLAFFVGAFPVLAQANHACGKLEDLELALDETFQNDQEDPDALLNVDETIELEDLVFQYHDPRTSHPFVVGPINLTIHQGEVLFIAGGNGTGKSTLLKLLTTLYRPQKGLIRVDGVPLGAKMGIAYRELFCAVYSDYHLFDRLYGLGHIENEEVEEMMRDLGLEGKTHLVDGEFETLDLSGGQKKRLAMMVALLEDRPLVVFDEWAADQDPIFKKHFYREILPQLKEQGKTVIAVTHDDKYFDAGDRCLKMEDGRFVEFTVPPRVPEPQAESDDGEESA